MIPCSNPRAQYLAHWVEIDAAITRVLEQGWYILGEETKAFETEFAEYLGVGHAIGVGSGSFYYPVPVHLQPAYSGRIVGSDKLPVTERAAAQVLSLPIYPELGEQDIDAVIARLKSFGW